MIRGWDKYFVPGQPLFHARTRYAWTERFSRNTPSGMGKRISQGVIFKFNLEITPS